MPRAFLTVIQKNLFAELLLPIKKRPGQDEQTVPVYGCHYQGVDEVDAYIGRVKNFARQCRSRNIPLLIFNSRLYPARPEAKLVNRLKNIPESGLTAADLALLLAGNFPQSSDKLPVDAWRKALTETLELFLSQKNNRTQIINFAAKLISWLASVPAKDFFRPGAEHNPKALFFGELKEHEGLFLIALSHLFWDVVYLNPEKKAPPFFFSQIARLKEEPEAEAVAFFLSDSVSAAAPSPAQKLAARPAALSARPGSSIAPPSRSAAKYPMPDLEQGKRLFAVRKEAQDPFVDLLKPWQERSEFSVKDALVVSVYGCSVVGSEPDQKIYENKLFAFYARQSKKADFCKIEGSLPLTGEAEVIRLVKDLTAELEKIAPAMWIACLAASSALRSLPDFLRVTILREMDTLLKKQEEKKVNPQARKNFLAKILLWFLSLGRPLLASINKETAGQVSPCLLFFGNPKKHEMEFLLFLNRVGCDILHINPEKRLDFPELAAEFQTIDYGHYAALDKFPATEHIVRQETAAHRASRQIDQVMRDADSGFYRPWQFQNAKTSPLGLRTTYDELKILWKEEALVRPGFKVTEERVYLPNIFAKISGVHAKLGVYLEDARFFIDAPLTYVFSELPLIAQKVKSGNVFVVSNLFDNQGNIRAKELRDHPLYEFAHLPTSLQDLFVRKIGQFFETPLLQQSVEIDLRKKAVITLLSMDSEILQLWQQYDYPRKVPKIVVFDNKTATFALEDAILVGFLYLLGFDILILTPTGYNNLEGFVNREFFDIHKLEALNFEINFDKLKQKPLKFFTHLFRNR